MPVAQPINPAQTLIISLERKRWGPLIRPQSGYGFCTGPIESAEGRTRDVALPMPSLGADQKLACKSSTQVTPNLSLSIP